MKLHSSSQGLAVAIGTAAGQSLNEYAKQCRNNGIASDKLLIDTAEGRYEYLADHEIERLPRMMVTMMASALARRPETQREAMALRSSGVADTEHGAAGKPIVGSAALKIRKKRIDHLLAAKIRAARDPRTIAAAAERGQQFVLGSKFRLGVKDSSAATSSGGSVPRRRRALTSRQ